MLSITTATQDQDDEFVRECRICHSKSSLDLIQSPCSCKGSMGCVHIVCLERWLYFSSNNSCELCSYKFKVVKVRKYSFVQSTREWVRRDNLNILRGLTVLLVLTLNSAVAFWLWIFWLGHIPDTFFNAKPNEVYDEAIITDTGEQSLDTIGVTKWTVVFVVLTVMATISISSLYFDGYKKVVRRFYRSWSRIRNETHDVHLILDLQNLRAKDGTLEANEGLPLPDLSKVAQDGTLQQIKITVEDAVHVV